MTNATRYTLVWAPRVLMILFIIFVSLFALDVFDEKLGFWRTLAALGMHLIPTFVLIAMLVVAWRREWIGALLFTAAGIFFAVMARGLPAKAVFAGTLFIVAALYLFNWLKRADVHPVS